MNYKINFRDKTSAIISKQEGDQLKEMMLNNTVPTNIEINGDLHRASEILSVVKEADVMEDLDLSDAKKIEVGKRCRGQYSMAWAINKELKRMYGNKFLRHIRDKELRASIREELLATGEKFCDLVANTCACEPGYFSERSRTHEILDVSSVFPTNAKHKRSF